MSQVTVKCIKSTGPFEAMVAYHVNITHGVWFASRKGQGGTVIKNENTGEYDDHFKEHFVVMIPDHGLEEVRSADKFLKDHVEIVHVGEPPDLHFKWAGSEDVRSRAETAPQVEDIIGTEYSNLQTLNKDLHRAMTLPTDYAELRAQWERLMAASAGTPVIVTGAPVVAEPTLKERFQQAFLNTKDPQVLTVAVKLPNGAVEVITNHRGNIGEKAMYYENAYDEDFRLKANEAIQIVGFMLI